ncbi:spore gernimation protein [Lysinibacillus sphaericus]|uniref:Ger(x)C family spore germination protein n=1 Tax=Lysinibacillus sphaericus TaxID=1421 RepID=UPI0018CF984C|nr:Ger(x)C family spore germination protein [Lysinibacillus sphaericus]MBG9453852.1 spore gernimation protein [Lysinibacillus sphaericus]MBG9476322.1 spore gernimation protein [Lysinibacillus sphaericus]MBG9591737.1 spore gernimation protein [Lysinibacillus sphaericus]
MSKCKAICLLMILTIFLSGCWSKRELNELAIVAALGIDKVDNEFDITVQVVIPGEISSKQPTSGRSPVITYHSKGATVFEAIRKMTTVTARKLYFSHLQIVVLGDELAKEGMGKPLDLISRDHEFRNDFDVIVAHDATAEEVLNVLTPIEKVPANKMLNSLRTSEKSWGTTQSIKIDELIITLNNKETSVVMSAIEIHGDKSVGMAQTNVKKSKSTAILKYAGLAVFKEDKYIGLLTEDESRSLGFLKDKIESTIEIIACPKEGNLSTEITHSKTKIKGKFENGSPKINVSIDVNQNVGEVECDIDLTKEKSLHYVNKKTAELIKKRIEKTISTVQQSYRVDIFGFGEALHRTNPKEWKKIKKDWLTIFQELPVKVEVHVNTQGLGTMENSLVNKPEGE